jgi:hypothetical protein
MNPNTLRPDGTCPECGRPVADPDGTKAAQVKTPWHFKLLVAVTVLYLVWRLIQMIGWVVT